MRLAREYQSGCFRLRPKLSVTHPCRSGTPKVEGARTQATGGGGGGRTSSRSTWRESKGMGVVTAALLLLLLLDIGAANSVRRWCAKVLLLPIRVPQAGRLLLLSGRGHDAREPGRAARHRHIHDYNAHGRRCVWGSRTKEER